MLKKAFKLIFAIAFFCVSIVPTVAMLFTDKTETPDINNFTEIPEKVETFFSDNLGLKDEMITTDSKIKYNVFKSSAVNNVIIGKDGWLYFRETLDDYQKSNSFTDRTVYRIAKTTELMNEYCNEFGVTMAFTIAPNKNSVYPQYMPSKYKVEDKASNLDRLNVIMSEKDYYVDLKKLFTDELDPNTVYYHQRDSHWNGLGAMQVYRALQKNIASRNEIHYFNNYSDAQPGEVTYSGDLTQMLFPAILNGEKDFEYSLGSSYNQGTAGINPMSNNIETHGGKQNYSICCYRDSFFNSMIYLFSNDANRARYTRQMQYDLINMTENDYDIVIVEMAERNMENIVLYTPDCLAVRKYIEPSVTECKVEQLCMVADEENVVSFSGKIENNFTELKADDNIYVEFRSKEKSVFFEAFPTSDNEPLEDNGFSIKVEKNELPIGEYEIYVHVGNEKSTKACKAVQAAL